MINKGRPAPVPYAHMPRVQIPNGVNRLPFLGGRVTGNAGKMKRLAFGQGLARAVDPSRQSFSLDYNAQATVHTREGGCAFPQVGPTTRHGPSWNNLSMLRTHGCLLCQTFGGQLGKHVAEFITCATLAMEAIMELREALWLVVQHRQQAIPKRCGPPVAGITGEKFSR